MIHFFFEEVKRVALKQRNISTGIIRIIELESKLAGNLNFIFCSDNYLLDINKQYLQHDYYTDVISFNYCEDDIISGDIFISLDRVKENAKSFGEKYRNELLRVMIHGVLHFIGYADKTDQEIMIMREKENYYLNIFKNEYI